MQEIHIQSCPRGTNTTHLTNQVVSHTFFIQFVLDLQATCTRSVCILFLQTSVDSQEACQGPRGVTRQYQIRYQIGSFKVYESVNTTACRAERCSHTYNLLNVDSVPSSYDSVSVAAENVVGFGAARTCTAQPISELTFIMCISIGFN